MAEDDDAPPGQDLQDSDRIVRRLADHHSDPEARRLYRQLVARAKERQEGSS